MHSVYSVLLSYVGFIEPKWQLWTKKMTFLREQMSSLHLTSYLVSWTALALGHCPRYVLRFPFGLHHILVFGTSEVKITIIIFTSISLEPDPNPDPKIFIGPNPGCAESGPNLDTTQDLETKIWKMSGWEKIFHQC